MTEDCSPDLSTPGLDLSDPDILRLIRRIYWARHAPRVERMGMDPEDVHSEILLALVRKQASPRSRWDPARAGVSKYVYMVCGSVISHMADARRARPVLVLDEGREDEDGDRRLSPVDRAQAPEGVGLLDLRAVQEAVDEATGRELPLPVLARVLGGQGVREAARAEGVGTMEAMMLAEAWRAFTAGPGAPDEPGSVLDLFR